ncbi:uncharacterized protein B0T15DRAFT_554911 [Chaetomium strumarium]|uniref:Cyclin-like domain-containing protein n=1 Tax=Chaetomium strumarium TaxID=1170767 RepID=A0AAJ0M130_9PEZI|nr:hypothetical protein B0T15DRAFT_554911 [Chaetomium strumarium]
MMDSLPKLSPAELNAAALERFVAQPVDEEMIRYLAKAATGLTGHGVLAGADETLPTVAGRVGRGLPTIERFIMQLVVSSNVPVPTLMSSLVYLRRLKPRVQPMAKGLRQTHRIFLASLILAAKYLNDKSLKNADWAAYSVIRTQAYSFGFSKTEVNVMESQLLSLLDWDLGISDEDLYLELDYFLAPIRADIQPGAK